MGIMREDIMEIDTEVATYLSGCTISRIGVHV